MRTTSTLMAMLTVQQSACIQGFIIVIVIVIDPVPLAFRAWQPPARSSSRSSLPVDVNTSAWMAKPILTDAKVDNSSSMEKQT